ncbi:heat shock factor binding protein 1-domain-containing protein [Astrocystis sublimbata]|nr:heat shock factor binding protein 1-domain-containing protein [Astrocystis sublimbata]
MAPKIQREEEDTVPTGSGSDELSAALEDLLNQLGTKFSSMSSDIFSKMDEMSRRLDTLEAALRANEEKSAVSSKS